MFNSEKSLILSIIVVAIVILGALPTLAQYDQDDIEQAVCVHVEISTGPTGEYIRIFLYQDDLNALFNGYGFPDIDIEVTEPYTTFNFNLVIAPQNYLFIITDEGYVEVVNFKDGQVIYWTGGSVSFSTADMDTDCRGAATDGRLNRFDHAGLAVIYNDGNAGYNIWKIDATTSEGMFDYNVTRAQVDAALAAGGGLIGQGATSSLYAISSTECQLQSTNQNGDPQYFTFNCQ